jgi:hypothetical protein
MRSPLFGFMRVARHEGHGQASCLPTRAAVRPGSGCGNHSDGPAFSSLTRVKFDNMSVELPWGIKTPGALGENRNRPVGKGENAIVAAVRNGRDDPGAQLNLRNFGNLTAIKDKAGAFSENRGQVTRSLRRISGIPRYGAQSLAAGHSEADQAGRAASSSSML